jgi:hypothetical protein
MSTSLAVPRGVPAWVIHVAIDRERPSIRFRNARKRTQSRGVGICREGPGRDFARFRTRVSYSRQHRWDADGGVVARDALNAAPNLHRAGALSLIDLGEIDQGRSLYSLRKIVSEKAVDVSGSCAQVQFNGGKQ